MTESEQTAAIQSNYTQIGQLSGNLAGYMISSSLQISNLGVVQVQHTSQINDLLSRVTALENK
jgi:hypothetical protein